ncbi:MAG TPA: hypothetical protein PKI71_01350 [Candidatus Rifleibacterium sp.]|nr:hypothetical protein [Candidatus Rifleibacterium sp.]
MAALALTVQNCALTGLEPVYVPANAEGNYFANDGKTLLHVVNAGVADITVTIDSPVLCNQGFAHDEAVVVPAGKERMIGPFTPSRFNANGVVNVSYSDVTDVTAAAIKVE